MSRISAILFVLALVAGAACADAPDLPTPGDSSQADTWGTLLNTYIQANDNVYNAYLEYDADNTGATDASTEIQAAIDACGDDVGMNNWTDGEGIVFLPAGTYLLTDAGLTMKNNMQLVGAGVWNTQLILDCDDANAITVDNYCQNWTIRDLSIRARLTGDDPNGRGISIDTGARFFEIKNVAIGYPDASKPQMDYGLYIEGSINGTYAVYLGSIEHVYVFRARDYPFYSVNAAQCHFRDCFFTAGLVDTVHALAYIGGTNNLFERVTVDGYPIGFHIVGSGNHLLNCRAECDGYATQYPTGTDEIWCAKIERVSGYPEQAGVSNTIQGGDWGGSLTTGGGFCWIHGGNNNLWDRVNLSVTDADDSDVFYIDDSHAKHNTFISDGDTDFTTALTVDDPANMVTTVTVRTDSTYRYRTHYFDGDAPLNALDLWVGPDANGVGLRGHANSATSMTRAGLLVSYDNSSTFPWDAEGHLIVKPYNTAGSTIQLRSGATAVVRADVNETYARFYVPITASGTGFIGDVNSVSADFDSVDPYGTTIVDTSGEAMDPNLLDGTTVGQRCRIQMKTAGNNFDLVIAHHVTSDPETVRLDTAEEWIECTWDGTDWIVTGSGHTYP